MKKLFQILGISSILVFSFYYTDKIALIIEQKNPILEQIQEQEDSLYLEATSATIIDDYIIPGLYGSKVNVEKSFYNMKALNTFNEYYVVYDDIKPDISLEDNKDKIIISGNTSKREISIIIEYNVELINYFRDYNIDLLVNKDTFDSTLNFELINNEVNQQKFKEVQTLLNKNNLNSYICLVNENNQQICKDNNYYLVKNSITFINNLNEVKQQLDNGSIILISSKAKLNQVKLLVDYITYHDLKIVYLSELISEKNDM